jgi:hypothetical protein
MGTVSEGGFMGVWPLYSFCMAKCARHTFTAVTFTGVSETDSSNSGQGGVRTP